MSQSEPDGRRRAPDTLEVEARTHRRTALVELWGELDLSTVPRVAEVLDGIAPNAGGVRHIVLDLPGLTFTDASGLHELIPSTTTRITIGTTLLSCGGVRRSSDCWR